MKTKLSFSTSVSAPNVPSLLLKVQGELFEAFGSALVLEVFAKIPEKSPFSEIDPRVNFPHVINRMEWVESLRNVFFSLSLADAREYFDNLPSNHPDSKRLRVNSANPPSDFWNDRGYPQQEFHDYKKS